MTANWSRRIIQQLRGGTLPLMLLLSLAVAGCMNSSPDLRVIAGNYRNVPYNGTLFLELSNNMGDAYYEQASFSIGPGQKNFEILKRSIVPIPAGTMVLRLVDDRGETIVHTIENWSSSESNEVIIYLDDVGSTYWSGHGD
jgi:hypothetical protein